MSIWHLIAEHSCPVSNILDPIIPRVTSEPTSVMVSPTISLALQRMVPTEIFSDDTSVLTGTLLVALVNGIPSGPFHGTASAGFSGLT